MNEKTAVSFNQAVDIINENRKAFKAGILAGMHEAHQLACEHCSFVRPHKNPTWTSKDEAKLGELYNEYLNTSPLKKAR